MIEMMHLDTNKPPISEIKSTSSILACWLINKMLIIVKGTVELYFIKDEQEIFIKELSDGAIIGQRTLIE